MNVICLNDHFKDAKGNIPANQPMVGDIDEVICIVSCPLGHVMYELKRFPNIGWDANQFSPLSEIDETDFVRNYNEKA